MEISGFVYPEIKPENGMDFAKLAEYGVCMKA